MFYNNLGYELKNCAKTNIWLNLLYKTSFCSMLKFLIKLIAEIYKLLNMLNQVSYIFYCEYFL